MSIGGKVTSIGKVYLKENKFNSVEQSGFNETVDKILNTYVIKTYILTIALDSIIIIIVIIISHLAFFFFISSKYQNISPD